MVRSAGSKGLPAACDRGGRWVVFVLLLRADARLRVYFNTFNTFNYVYVPAEPCWIRLCGVLSAQLWFNW